MQTSTVTFATSHQTRNAFFRVAALAAASMLVACGGGAPDSSGIASTQAAGRPTVSTQGNGNGQDKVAASAAGTDGTAKHFNAHLGEAPATGSILSAAVTLSVNGKGITRAALLPPTSGAPALAELTVAPDGRSAYAYFDSAATLPNGTLRARLVAFDQNGAATEVMPVREWTLRNAAPHKPQQIPAADTMPSVVLRWGDLPYVDPAPLAAFRAGSDAERADAYANQWTTVEALLRRYVPRNVDLLQTSPGSIVGEWNVCIAQHSAIACDDVIRSLVTMMTSKAGS